MLKRLTTTESTPPPERMTVRAARDLLTEITVSRRCAEGEEPESTTIRIEGYVPHPTAVVEVLRAIYDGPVQFVDLPDDSPFDGPPAPWSLDPMQECARPSCGCMRGQHEKLLGACTVCTDESPPPCGQFVEPDPGDDEAEA